MSSELRRALRALAGAPGFALASIVTLGVGLGATAGIFTVVEAVLLRPLPYPAVDRVVRIAHVNDRNSSPMPLARFALPFFARESHSFDVIGGYWNPDRYTLGGEGSAERIVGVRATPGLLDVIGARAAAGRLFDEDDGRFTDEWTYGSEASSTGIVISHRLWLRRFGADPGVVGTTVLVDGTSREILGVMAADTDLPRQKVDLWLPYTVPENVAADDAYRLYTLARLRDDVEIAQAAAELDGLTARFPEVADFYSVILEQYHLQTIVRPVLEEVVGEVERPLWIALGAVAVVLLVAAANVATLFLVRAEGRGREVAVRKALGASRTQLIGHFLAEGLCITGVSLLLALALAVVAVGLFRNLAPAEIPRLDEIAVGGQTAIVAVVLSLGLAVALGLYPFFRFGRRTPATPGARIAGEGRSQATVGGGLVIFQVALALLLLSGSALMLETFRRLRAVDPGFRPAGILVSEVSLPAPFYPDAADVHGFRDRLVERLRGIPDVRGVAFGRSPLEERGCNGLYVEGMVLEENEFPPCVPVVFVGSDYWELLGITLREGRTFTEADVTGPAVAVVTANFAERLWPDGDALTAAVHPSPRPGPPWFPVVGIVSPVRNLGPDQPAGDALYLPLGAMDDEGWLERTFVIHVATTPGEELGLVPQMRNAVATLDPGVPLTVHGPLEDELARTMIRSTFTLFLLGTAAATALLLGLVGLYGVVAHRVESRRTEIGVRMAVGATAAQVRKLVVTHSLRLVLAGTAIGLVAAALLSRTLASLLYEVRPGDPLLLGLAALALLAAAALATWLPAHRATTIDPVGTLRND